MIEVVSMPVPTSTVPTTLRRQLGLREALAIGVGGTVGGGIFTLVEVAAGAGGPACLLSFVLAFAVSLLIALPYAELACRLPAAGGSYAFVRAALGTRWGFVMGWTYWGGYLLASGYVTIGFGQYLRAATGLPVTAGALGLVALCVAVNVIGVRLSGHAQTVLFGVAVVGFLAFGCWGLSHARWSTMTPFAPHGGFGVLAATPVVFLAFGGFDMVAANGEEIRRPERNLPLAILLTLACVLALYLLVAFAAFTTTPANVLASSSSPLADAAARFGGGPARWLMLCCALLTLAAAANAILMATSRAMFAMARDRLLPARLGHVDRRTGAPWLAVTVDGALLACVAAFGSVSLAARAGGFLYVAHFLPPLVALVVLRRGGTTTTPPFRTPLPKLIIPLAFVCGLAMLAFTGVHGAVIGLGWLAVGVLGHEIGQAVRRRGPSARGHGPG